MEFSCGTSITTSWKPRGLTISRSGNSCLDCQFNTHTSRIGLVMLRILEFNHTCYIDAKPVDHIT